MTRPRRSARITGPHRYHETVRPCAPHRYSAPRGSAAWGSPFHARPQAITAPLARPRTRDDRFPRSTPKPGPSSRHLHAGRHLGSKQVSPRPIPGQDSKPGFAVVSGVFDTSSVVRLRSPPWPTPDALHGAPFPQRSAPRLLTDAPCGGLRPSPAGRPRRPTDPTAGPSISDAAPHQSARPSTSRPPHAFAAHGSRSPSPAPSGTGARPARSAGAATNTQARGPRPKNDPPPPLTLPFSRPRRGALKSEYSAPTPSPIALEING
jgi:hypothetical protein